MNLALKGIRDFGVANDERVVMSVINDTDCGYFMLVLVRIIDGEKFRPNRQKYYWIPDKKVSKGDLVIVYTKEGESSVKDNKDGSKSYFFYWGLKETIFNSSTDSAALISIDDWQFFPRENPIETGAIQTAK